MNQHTGQCEPVKYKRTLARIASAFLLLSLFLGTALSNHRAFAMESVSAASNTEANGTAEGRQATLITGNTTTIHAYSSAFAKSGNPAALQPAATTDRQIASYNPLLWIFDVTLDLHTDYDHDGHYSNFSLTLDLDTSLAATTVYAVLYLASEGGPWNEYAVTGNFTVSGRGSADTFSLRAELDSGYPSGYYNHYIEVYDAHSHELIGSYGPEDSYHLYGLPIESRSHDGEFTFGTDISLSFSGTGSMSPGVLALLATSVVAGRRRLRRKPKVSR